MFRPELLSPAGTLKNMRYAYAYGADAVYAGQPRYSLRVRNNEFDHENLQLGINEAHALGKAVLCGGQHSAPQLQAQDLHPRHAPRSGYEAGCTHHVRSGLIMMMREAFPDMPIHLSVQANAVNWATVKFWHQMGLTRAILSRELSLDEIEEIRMQVPEMELEVFVHGALCMAYSAAACSPATSTSVTPIRAPAPTPAAGSTRCTRARKMTWARSSTARSPSPLQRWIRPWAQANRPMPWCCWKSPTARASS